MKNKNFIKLLEDIQITGIQPAINVITLWSNELDGEESHQMIELIRIELNRIGLNRIGEQTYTQFQFRRKHGDGEEKSAQKGTTSTSARRE